MKITVPVKLIAADTDARTISGRIVTWEEVGFTSAGKTIFAKDSIMLKPVKLFIDHNMDKPIGKVLDYEVTDKGIDAVFKIANTQRGSDSLVEAMEGLKDGFSVGIKLTDYDNTDEGLRIKNSNLVEVSLVETPAIDSARVSEVAASEVTNETKGSDMTGTPELQTENEVSVEAAQIVAAAPATAAPVFTKPRVDTNVTAGQIAIAQMRAQLGNTQARDLVAAIENQNTTTDSGLIPEVYLRDIIGIVDGQRPFWDSLQSGVLPASGMKFFKPRRVVLAEAAVTAEEAEFASTATEIDHLEVDIVKIAGANIVSVELIDRSDPSYVDELLLQLAADWSRKTDVYAQQQVLGGSPGTSSGATLYGAIAQGIADSYGVMRRTPNRFLADVGNYAELLGAVDLAERPLFSAAAPQNAGGLVTQGSTNGTIAGLNLVVTPNFDTGTGVKGVVYPSDAGSVYQSAAIQLRSNIVANGQVEIGLYGYVAACANYETAIRNITIV